MRRKSPTLGIAAIFVAVGFNIPFLGLSIIYDYPDILRRPASEALALFAQGGTPLILTWHAFAWSALALVPLAIALGLTAENRATSEPLAIAAAITGALSGTVQAVGLWRWVFVIPGLAGVHADPQADEAAKTAANQAFDILNSYGGVAIGEHLGQWLIVFFAVSLSLLQWRQEMRVTAAVGFLTALAVAVGTTEGLAIALGRDGEVFSQFTVAGFLGLTVWLILTGLNQFRPVEP